MLPWLCWPPSRPRNRTSPLSSPRRFENLPYSFFFFFILSSSGWKKKHNKLTRLPRISIHVVCRLYPADMDIVYTMMKSAKREKDHSVRAAPMTRSLLLYASAACSYHLLTETALLEGRNETTDRVASSKAPMTAGYE